MARQFENHIWASKPGNRAAVGAVATSMLNFFGGDPMKTTRQNLKSIQQNDIDPLLILADLLRTEQGASDTANKLATEIKARLEALSGKINQLTVAETIIAVGPEGLPSAIMI